MSVWTPTDEQCIQFMCTGLRHAEYKRGNGGPTVSEIRDGLQATFGAMFTKHIERADKFKEQRARAVEYAEHFMHRTDAAIALLKACGTFGDFGVAMHEGKPVRDAIAAWLGDATPSPEGASTDAQDAPGAMGEPMAQHTNLRGILGSSPDPGADHE